MSLMVLEALGRNIDSGKLLRGANGKLCRGCCGEVAICGYCSGLKNITLELSGFSNQCDTAVSGLCLAFIPSTGAVDTDYDLAGFINAIHTLTEVSACRWEKEYTISAQYLNHYCNRPLPPVCGETPDGTDEFTRVKITYKRFDNGFPYYGYGVIVVGIGDVTGLASVAIGGYSNGVSECYPSGKQAFNNGGPDYAILSNGFFEFL